MLLSEMKSDTYGKVESVGGDARFLNRISSIGLNEGTSFKVVRNDRKMPVLIFVRETLLALNKKDSKNIQVSEVMA